MSQTPEEKKAHKRDYDKAYRAAHLEENRAYARSNYAAHREKRLAQSRTYREANKERRLDWNKAYYKAHRIELLAKIKVYQAGHKYHASPNNRRANWMKGKYGLSSDGYDALLERQGGVCAICGKADWNGRGPVIDHDHVSGKVRGVICGHCNTALGMAFDNIPTLERMIEYLKRHAPKAEAHRVLMPEVAMEMNA